MIYKIHYLTRLIKNSIHPCCIVLCYHRVGEFTNDYWHSVISIDNFRDHIKLISKYYPTVSMPDLVTSLNLGKLPHRRAVVITFDDGYASNLKYACDILDEFGVPAIFFMNSYTLESDASFWWDELQSILFESKPKSDSIQLELFSKQMRLPYRTIIQQQHAFQWLHSLMKGLVAGERVSILEALSKQFKKSNHEERRPLTHEEVIAISRNSLFDIGGHTHSHSALSLLPVDRQQTEIEKNKRILENLIEKPVVHFSYPFGGQDDFNEETIAVVKQAGFKSSSAVLRKTVRLGDDLFQIPRVSVKNWDAGTFKKKIDAFWSL